MKKRTVRPSRRVGIFVAIAGIVGVSGGAWADDAADVRAGEALAAKACAPCHAMPSQPTEGESAGVPGRSFNEIAKGDRAAPSALWEFLRTAHNNVSHPGNMPSQPLTEQQIRLLSAYIGSLRAAR